MDLNQVLNEDVLIPLMMGLVAIIIGVSSIIGKTIRSNSHERTKREIAAYIAEGSMTPEQGERVLKTNPKDSCC